jgi:septum site-determining protein MinC
VFADGDVHVYGALRGRALAGVSGAACARVYTTCFHAALVGIGAALVVPDEVSVLRVSE